MPVIPNFKRGRRSQRVFQRTSSESGCMGDPMIPSEEIRSGRWIAASTPTWPPQAFPTQSTVDTRIEHLKSCSRAGGEIVEPPRAGALTVARPIHHDAAPIGDQLVF